MSGEALGGRSQESEHSAAAGPRRRSAYKGDSIRIAIPIAINTKRPSDSNFGGIFARTVDYCGGFSKVRGFEIDLT